MNRRLNELHLRRGRLLERIAAQRVKLNHNLQPVHTVLHKADHVLDTVRSVGDYVKQHSGMAMIAVAALFFMNKGRLWRVAKRGFFAWQTFRALRNKLLIFGARARL